MSPRIYQLERRRLLMGIARNKEALGQTPSESTHWWGYVNRTAQLRRQLAVTRSSYYRTRGYQPMILRRTK